MPAPAILTRKDRRIFKMQVKSVEEKTNEAGIKVGKISGYGSVFGNLDYYNDIIQYGAFSKTLTEKSAFPILADHDTDRPIGMTCSLKEDAHGLLMEAEINLEVQDGREKYSLLKQGAINGLSIGFQIIKQEENKDTGIRTITEIRLWEISVVTFPANPAAEVTDVRSLSDGQAMALIVMERTKAGLKEVSKSLNVGLREKSYTETISEIDKVVDDLLTLREALDTQPVSIPAAKEAEPLDEHSVSLILREIAELRKI